MRKVTTAYDYRRVIALADILALKNDYDAEGHLASNLQALCNNWGVLPFKTGDGMDIPRTLQALSQHALEYSRKPPTIQAIKTDE